MSNKNLAKQQKTKTEQSLVQAQVKPQKKGKVTVKKLDLTKLSKQALNLYKKNTNRSDKDLYQQQFKLNAIRYKSSDTIKFNKKLDSYVQTDDNFVTDIKSIADKNRNMFGNLLHLKQNKYQLTNQQCDQVDYIARKHYKANKVNQNTKLKVQQANQNDKCSCGCQKIKGKSISFFTSINSMKYLGSGVLLIFMFIKALSLLMLFVTILYGIFSITTNFLGGQSPQAQACDSDYCRFVNNSANNNKVSPNITLIAQWWIGLIYCIVWLVCTRFIKYFGKQKNEQIDKRLKSASDLAIVVKKLPYGQYSQVQLLQYFQRIWHRLNRQLKIKQIQQKANEDLQQSSDNIKNGQIRIQNDNGNNFKMKSIQIIYSVEFARKITDKIIDLSTFLMEFVQFVPDQNGQKLIVIQNKKQYLQSKLELIQYLQLLGDLRKKFLYQAQFRKSISCELCLVEFQSQQSKNFLLEHFGKQKLGLLTQIQQIIKSYFIKKDQSSLMFKGKYLHIQRAPQPSDILWKNCQTPYSIKRTAFLYFITFIIISVSFGIIVALQYIQSYFIPIQNSSKTQAAQNASLITIINIITAIVLQVINKCLWFSLYYFLDQEYNYTLSERINSHMNKSLFAISVNVIILPIISNYYIKNKIFGTNGLSGMVFDYQISTLFISLPLKLFDPLEITKRIALYIRFTRNLIIRYYCKNRNLSSANYSQKGIKQINLLYEGSNFDIAQSYVYILGTIFHTAFFCQLQPAVLITGTLTTILFFFVLKAKLIYFCKIPEITDKLVFETALTQAAIVPLIYGAGTIATSYIQRSIDPSRPLQYHQGAICIILCIIVFFNPGDIFNKLVKKVMKKIEQLFQLNKKQQKDMMQNNDNYYKNSNSLDLLGFQNKIKGSGANQKIQKQLKIFCEQFFPKSNQKVINQRTQIAQGIFT